MDKALEAFLEDYYHPKVHEPAAKSIPSVAERQRIFCRDLAVARMRMPMSQKQLAHHIGTSQSAIARLEAGQGNPNLHTVLKICEQLNRNLVSRRST